MVMSNERWYRVNGVVTNSNYMEIRILKGSCACCYNFSNMWPTGQQIVLGGEQCVIENPTAAAQEESSNGDDLSSKSLQGLHEDLMEMITAL